MSTVKVAIVYHSGYGHTARQAQGVREGVLRVAGAEVKFLTTDEAMANLETLDAVDAIVFGAPTYMGSASAQFKAFMDDSSKAFFRSAWKDKIAAGFTNSASRSGDKLETLIQLSIFAAQHGMHWVSLGAAPGNNSSTGSEDDLNRLGFFLGAAAQSNADEGPEIAPPLSDILTAALLGERVATVALQLAAGKEALRFI